MEDFGSRSNVFKIGATDWVPSYRTFSFTLLPRRFEGFPYQLWLTPFLLSEIFSSINILSVWSRFGVCFSEDPNKCKWCPNILVKRRVIEKIQAFERYMGNCINTDSRFSLFLLNCTNTMLKDSKEPRVNVQLNIPHEPQRGCFKNILLRGYFSPGVKKHMQLISTLKIW